jgi:hypothetical protein
MTAVDISAEVTGWAVAEVGKQCFGEDYGVAVTLQMAPAQVPGGGVTVQPLWMLLLTGRSPLLGEGPIFQMHPVAAARPTEAEVKTAVTGALRQIREYAASKLAGANGHGPKVPG